MQEPTQPLDFTESDEDDDSDSDSESNIIIETGGELHAGYAASTSQVDDINDHNRELLHVWSAEQTASMISFAHLRIKDYLVLEGRESTRKYPVRTLNFDVSRVHVDMTIDCIRLMRLFKYQDGTEIHPQLYPMQYLWKHLEAIDLTSVTKSDERRIVSGLAWVFGTEEGADALAEGTKNSTIMKPFSDTLFSTNLYTKLVQCWLSKGIGYVDTFDDSMQDWISRAAFSVPDLLQYVGLTAAFYWLQRPSPNCKTGVATRWFSYVLRNVIALVSFPWRMLLPILALNSFFCVERIKYGMTLIG